jgi:hypothetical protein
MQIIIIDLKFVASEVASVGFLRLVYSLTILSTCTSTGVVPTREATMGGTKRMSKEEKRQAVLGIYHTTKQVYTENEIIKLAAKEGIAQGA